MNVESLLNLIFVLGTLLTTLVFGFIKIKSLKGRLILIAMILVPTVIFLMSFFMPASIFGKEALQEFVLGFGVFGVLALVLLQILQVIIAPLDYISITMLGGLIFGPFLGFILNYIGRVAGSILAFLIARKFGQPFIEKIIPKKDIKKYDKLWDKGLLAIFIMYWLPFFPDDAFSYLGGISKIKLKTFIVLVSLAHMTGVLTTTLAGTLGETAWFLHPAFLIIGPVTLVLGLIIFGIKRIRKSLIK
ncbi:VTT domain-containing protein [Candidatus Woesearchaeota archaeon]|nr:VTT domain-containing protein [Candidatus Woesearchaeota archaeon]